MLSEIRVSCSPHISKETSTRQVMVDVIIALIPAVAAAGFYFRIYAAILISVCIISAVLTELLCNIIRGKENPVESLGDFSAVVTGLILALSLPPAIPYWAAIIGSCFSIAVGKMVFGGLGSNIFNPAMVGRAFLTASFGMLMTTWQVPATINNQMPKIAVSADKVDARTQATPLAWSKQAIKSAKGANIVDKQLINTVLGSTGGCLGETSTLALLIGGLYLLIRQTITVRIPLAVLTSTLVFGWTAWLINPDAYVMPLVHLTTGGLLIGAFFIATDPVTAPLTPKGKLLFGVGIGIITMLIRIVGEYPEGVMYAVLLMNALTPLIDRLFKLTPIGGRPHG